MHSKYIASLNLKCKEELRKKLFDSQCGKCFICEETMDFVLHKNTLQIDHIIPLAMKGLDSPENFALTHERCNKSKQTSELKIARLLAKFDKLRRSKQGNKQDSVTLADLLKEFQGSKFSFHVSISNNIAKYSFSKINDDSIHESPVFTDSLSKQKSFFAEIPIEYMFHDPKINPRGIGSNLRKLLEEFHKGRPQLHVSLARIDTAKNQILIFDGQHKASAQILLGIKKLPVRIFINPDEEVLLTANTNAGDTLRQVAFDKSIKRRLGHSIFTNKITQYQKDHGLSEESCDFSEIAMKNYFKGESHEMKKYILDASRNGITESTDNLLRPYIEHGGKSKEKPLSYSTVEKTFYSFFIYQGLLITPLDYKEDEGKNPRELEKKQLVKLMNIIAQEIYENKYDFSIGSAKIENKIQQGENISDSHLIAYRMSKEEIIHNWLKYIGSIIQNYYVQIGNQVDPKKLFQESFPDQLWLNIHIFIRNLSNLPIWVNNELSSTIFGGKQNYAYWEHILKTGKTPAGVPALTSGIDFTKMMQENVD